MMAKTPMKTLQVAAWVVMLAGLIALLGATIGIVDRELAVRAMERDGLMVQRLEVSAVEGLSILSGLTSLGCGILLAALHRHLVSAILAGRGGQPGNDGAERDST
jgi:hypothetical protein